MPDPFRGGLFPLRFQAFDTETVENAQLRADSHVLAKKHRKLFTMASWLGLAKEKGTYIPTRPNYTYSADVSETRFRIIATYSGPDPKAPKRVSVDETMALRTD